jgi:hypothetical protein
MHLKALSSRIATALNSTFGVSNVAKLLVLSEPEAICQIDSSTLNATTTVRLFITGESRCWGGVAIST